ncbi:intraflagellar transport protein 80 homolog [Octopus sinensis]|uniref:Intraflagellar transport protein 80 homolog n=1 Tax=Octopus sinensis TaxID=2607531 RepID=A0A7E6EIU9_9MOLL|nr:intraflagellar transport protein 80 homolog [Octopus sinensis]
MKLETATQIDNLGGEDGTLKIWSNNGMLRSTVLQEGFNNFSSLENPVYSLAWNPTDTKQIVSACSKNLILCSLNANSEQIKWLAHEGSVLSVDWSKDNIIVSGGEDCRYKTWDSCGRLLYSSALEQDVITSVSCSPLGNFFVAGSFNTVRLCQTNGV